MGNVAPNLAALIGDTVGARLISHAGSLTNLAKYPASTVQILGKYFLKNFLFLQNFTVKKTNCLVLSNAI